MASLAELVMKKAEENELLRAYIVALQTDNVEMQKYIETRLVNMELPFNKVYYPLARNAGGSSAFLLAE